MFFFKYLDILLIHKVNDCHKNSRYLLSFSDFDIECANERESFSLT